MSPLLLAGALAFLPQAQRTVLTVGTGADAPDPAAPRYSQATTFTAHLFHGDGTTPVAGDTECGGAPCRVSVFEGATGSADTPVFLFDPTVAHDGTVIVRVPLVDGVPSADVLYAGTSDGAPWTLRVQFLGIGAGQVPDNPDCADGAPDGAANGLCPSSASASVLLGLENCDVITSGGLEGAIDIDPCNNDDDTLPKCPGACSVDHGPGQCGLLLSAEISDANGDASAGGTDVDGPGKKLIAGASVVFLFDANNNGQAEENEIVGTAVTNDAGVASLVFVLDPAFVRAGTYASGIFAEFGGDQHYAVSRSSERLVVHPADVDVSRTVIEADPKSVPADGISKSALRVRLVDKFNNALDENSDAHDVKLSTTLGTLAKTIARDPLDGTYTQTLLAGRDPGAAQVAVTVDGIAGPSITVTITGEKGGCSCGSGSAALTDAALPALLLLGVVLRRRVVTRTA
ncbi:MAG TPA: Ig-like domain-containing protein [Myxococcota bacterium]